MADLKRQITALERLPALELIEGCVYPGVAERGERPLETALADQIPDVAKLGPRGCEQSAIGAAGIRVDAALEQREEVLLAAGPLTRDPPASVLRRDCLPQESGQSSRITPERC